MPTRKPHIEIFRGRSLRWFVRIVGTNGEGMLVSEAYWSKRNADRAAHRLGERCGLAVYRA